MNVYVFPRFWRLIFVAVLAFACGGQVYQSVHLHHFHNDNFIEFEVSSHPSSTAFDHSSTHHHHDDPVAHESDTELSYEKQSFWLQTTREEITVSVDISFIGQDILGNLLPVVIETPKRCTQTTPRPKERYASFRIIRGPPALA